MRKSALGIALGLSTCLISYIISISNSYSYRIKKVCIKRKSLGNFYMVLFNKYMLNRRNNYHAFNSILIHY
ncbi:hypothetical protein RJG79_07445 [Mycoplasmatota bacterium WC44]